MRRSVLAGGAVVAIGAAAAAGTSIVHPFLDIDVASSVAHHFGAPGPVDRSAALRGLFGDLLPEVVLSRASKAHFDEAFISDHSRSFAAGWTGDGVDGTIVDPEALAREWRSEHPDARSLLLMQAAWLSGSYTPRTDGEDDMYDETGIPARPEAAKTKRAYRAPAIAFLGDVAELTQKTTGGADGATFLGLPIASI